ncbi:type II secretion system protein GspC [Glaciecola sp. KUL10]|uniref:type II secretion system protein GspC n=1 Tax=Glaciecola sp. (strain KUL10) TaxID=2161813 RepID=UPI000D7882B5|nr:type II secretion system protein GspC [Glaciecola sp. KUL10]GBL04396.1 general secretion pathway protein C [Glaciecola sp. KUL10]
MTVDNFSFAPLQRAYQQHQDKLILIIVVLLSLYLIAFLAEVTWRLLDNSQGQVTQNNVTSRVNVQNQNNTRTDLSELKRLNLFGNASEEPAPVVEQAVTEAPETKLNLTLTGVVSSSSPKLGAAIIQRNNVQNTYGIGDKIDGTNATLDEIYVDRVIIKNRLVRETLMLDGIDFDEANKQQQRQAQSRQAQTANSPRTPNTQVTRTQRIEANREVQDMRRSMVESPTSFADFISIKPHAPDGEMVGYRVSPGKQAEFFKMVGLRSGDIITEINGLDLSDLQQSLEAIEALKESQSLQMEIIRSGEPISLDIDMPEPEES